MKKILAFGVAFLLFLAVTAGINQYFVRSCDTASDAFAYWRDPIKYNNCTIISESLNESNILILGSSELGSSAVWDTRFHPRHIFPQTDLRAILIGMGYCQSLWQAITLGAVSGVEPVNKVVLILSPQWFLPEGIEDEAFASKFSEKNLLYFLKNDSISKELKTAVMSRILPLLKDSDPIVYNRVTVYNNAFIKTGIHPLSSLYSFIYSSFLDVRSNYDAYREWKSYAPNNSPYIGETVENIDWNQLILDAHLSGDAACTNNTFGIYDAFYSKNIENVVHARKGIDADHSYVASREYDDLRMFLSVCKELNIKLLLISVPVKGTWYDYTGWPQSDRDRYYQNIRDLATEYNAELADFSGNEHDMYFLSDTMHLGWEGWTYVSKSIYEFAKSN